MPHDDGPTPLLTRARDYHDALLTAVASGFLAIQEDVLPLLRECAALLHDADVENLTRAQADAVIYQVTALEALARQVGDLLRLYQAILTSAP